MKRMPCSGFILRSGGYSSVHNNLHKAAQPCTFWGASFRNAYNDEYLLSENVILLFTIWIMYNVADVKGWVDVPDESEIWPGRFVLAWIRTSLESNKSRLGPVWNLTVWTRTSLESDQSRFRPVWNRIGLESAWSLASLVHFSRPEVFGDGTPSFVERHTATSWIEREGYVNEYTRKFLSWKKIVWSCGQVVKAFGICSQVSSSSPTRVCEPVGVV